LTQINRNDRLARRFSFLSRDSHNLCLVDAEVILRLKIDPQSLVWIQCNLLAGFQDLHLRRLVIDYIDAALGVGIPQVELVFGEDLKLEKFIETRRKMVTLLLDGLERNPRRL
jgi:hypothetical protein